MKAGKPLAILALLAVLAGVAWLFLTPAPAPDLHLSEASAAPLSDTQGAVAVFVTIENAGGPDRLTGAASPAAQSAMIEAPVAALAIPAGSTPTLAADGAFIRLEGVEGALSEGQLIPVTLMFERAGEQNLQARLVAPRDTGHAMHHGLPGMGDVHMVGAGEPAPQLALTVMADGRGWRVEAVTEGFTFSRDLADGPHQPGTGHGHLYLNGLKLGRLYEPQAHIGALPPGTHTVRVTLNTNDHRAYLVDHVPVSAEARIVVD